MLNIIIIIILFPEYQSQFSKNHADSVFHESIIAMSIC